MSGRLAVLLALSPLCFGQNSSELPSRQVSLMDVLQSTLKQHPAIKVQERQVDLEQGALQVAKGQFDTVYAADAEQTHLYTPLTRSQQASAAEAGFPSSALATWGTTYDASARRLFRNGISIGPSAQINRDLDNLQNRPGLNTSNASFQVVIPLLRGRGREVVGAQENSARITVDASVYDLNHSIAQLLASAASQYWNAVAANLNLEILKSAEARGRAYVTDVQTLIDADRVPRGEINQLLANLAGRTASRIGGEQQVLAAQQALAVSMGLSEAEMLTFPSPSDPLPDWNSETTPQLNNQLVQEFVERALKKRADLLAAQRRQEAAGVLIPAAKNQLRPQLDLNLRAGYSGLLEGTNYFRVFGSPFQNVGGADSVASLRYSFAPRNNTALGTLAQTEAAYQQALLRQDDLARNIASGVVTSMTNLVSTISRLQRARDAVRSYQLALNGEQEKFRLGIGSLVDVLTIEDRLTNANSQALSAQLDFSLAIENLRFATGTVVDPDTRTHVIELNTFLRLPFEWEQP